MMHDTTLMSDNSEQEGHFQTTDIGVYVKPMTPVDYENQRYSYAVAILNRNLARQMVFTLKV